MPKTKKFRELLKGVQSYYTGKPVPKQYQHRYGKTYSRSEARSVGYAIAKSRGWKV